MRYIQRLVIMCKYRLVTLCAVSCVGSLFLLLLFDAYVIWSNDREVPLNVPVMLSDNRDVQKEEAPDLLDVFVNESDSMWDGIHMRKLKTISGEVNMNGKIISSPVFTSFHPGLNVTYRRLMRRLIGAFADIASRNNVTYFLYGGSLIGSYRNHGMIPWDDDVDVAVYASDKHKLKAMFNKLPKDISALVQDLRWKMFYNTNPRIREDIPWSFPFLDISFFRVIPHFVVDGDPGWANRFKFNITEVFPLVLRPFWGMWLPAPRNTRFVIEKTYKIDTCMSNSYSHMREDHVKRVYTLPCKKFEEFYPHVRRTMTNSSRVVEELVFDGKVVQRFIFMS